jgi:hypothetical protein
MKKLKYKIYSLRLSKEKPSRKQWVKKLDVLWSQVVKLRAKGMCEKCGRKEYLNSHHIFSRSNFSTRWDIDNGIALCPTHHTLGNDSAHKCGIEFAEWLKDKRGEEWYKKLRFRAHQIYKADYNLIYLDLQNELKKYSS